MSTKKMIRELSQIVSEVTHDFKCEQTNGGHYKFTIARAGKKRVVIAPATPRNEWRSMLNFRADVKRTYAALA